MLIVADLTFRGEQPASLDSDVDTILFEMPDWVIVQNESAAIKIGDLYIHADSLLYGVRTAPAGSTAPLEMTTTISPSTPSPTPTLREFRYLHSS